MSKSRLAPTTSVRPQPRPADLQTQGGGQQQQHISDLAPDRVPRPRPRPKDLWTPSSPGMYPGMGMQDETGEFGKLGYSQLRDPSEIVLHQTDSSSAESTKAAYRGRVRNGKNVGAHYLIDTDGETSLTVPTNKKVAHAKGHNSKAIGIENVGLHQEVNMRGDLHAQIEALDLAPGLKEELLALSPAQLKSRMSDNGGNIYEDISGPQKRSTWNLLNKLTADHGLDMEDDVVSHEHIQAKTIGEGENIEEMVDAMVAWPNKIEQLRAHIEELKAQAAPGDAISAMEATLAEQEANFAAVQADATIQEENALEGEQILGEGGPATAREERRVAFWNEFYANMAKLDAALGG
mgnify:CR=1 FL=1